jgi:hypothetical protein
MSQSTKRYKKFLENYEFYPNSVHFRIYSSKALEKFKNVQSFQLNQISNGKYYFSHDRREILLLKYDMWSRWLYEVENLMIELSGNHPEFIIDKKDIELIISLAEKTSETYKNVILHKHSESFDQIFTNIWLKIHESPFRYMVEKIKDLIGYNFETTFIKIVDILVEVMQYTLYEIYELDSVICKFTKKCSECNEEDGCKKIKDKDECIFLIITEMAYKSHDKIKICLITERLKYYKEHFNIDEVYFKNYTDGKIKSRLIDEIERENIKINFRKSLIEG